MEIIEKLIFLQNRYEKSTSLQKNGTKLVGLNSQTPPLAKHYIYAPMHSSVQKHLIESYNMVFPEDLLRVYEFANGFDLFWKYVTVGKREIRIPQAQISVYGVPGTMRDSTRLEPFNISVEDLNRPEMTPDTWLKFGKFMRILDSGKQTDIFDLFVDTQRHGVYAINRANRKCVTEKTWPSIDECLCDLFTMFYKEG